MNTLLLHRTADRVYRLAEGTIGDLRAYLEAVGGVHMRPKVGDLYQHRWVFLTPVGKSVISYFAETGRLICLGPAVPVLEHLVVETEVLA